MNETESKLKNYLINNPEIAQQLYALIEIVNINKACLKLYRVDNKEELLLKSSLCSQDSL
jgi:hypothetical protein